MRRLLAFVCAAALLASCATSGVSFRDPRTIEILSPADRGTVRLPFTLRWTIDPAAGTDRVAVFIDAGPIPPGESLAYVARNDDSCKQVATCPDEGYLNERNIYTSTSGTITFEGLGDTRPLGRPSVMDAHRFTLVLIDASGRRLSEEARSVTVYVDRTQE